MNTTDWKALCELFVEFYRCEQCAETDNIYRDVCPNPLHAIHDAIYAEQVAK
jgi:hypothetical protein